MDLRQQLKASGVRQRDVAELLGVSEATVSKWLSRKQSVPAAMVLPLARVLGLSGEDVLAAVTTPARTAEAA